ncbi:hypothetical protein [Maridesulfovibrio sp.]|uniref:hypothetical protein n=1 Tax=Maridesulfovibrio sp. TaxID=2795000 RepID=UPI002A188AD8|nr:hypothetical protein [Maridesulfovibrio sp.]
MTFSQRNLAVSVFLFTASLVIVACMHLPVFDGRNGFQAMESSFNSLRKGLKPPFAELEGKNDAYLGRNFSADLDFRDMDQARAATAIFLANKLTVTPRDTSINIQGDFGYTLKYFIEDIRLLYMNRFDELQRRYSMPPLQSMYMLDRILKQLAISMASQKLKKQETLVQEIRDKLLIPAYNLREALPLSGISGFVVLITGTVGILLFAVLWDISNYMFFGTLVSEGFMHQMRVALGRELSDKEKAVLKKKKEILARRKKKLEEAKAAAARKQVEEMMEVRSSGRTNKEAMRAKSPEKKKSAAEVPERKKRAGKEIPGQGVEAQKKKSAKKKVRKPGTGDPARTRPEGGQKTGASEGKNRTGQKPKTSADARSAADKPRRAKVAPMTGSATTENSKTVNAKIVNAKTGGAKAGKPSSGSVPAAEHREGAKKRPVTKQNVKPVKKSGSGTSQTDGKTVTPGKGKRVSGNDSGRNGATGAAKSRVEKRAADPGREKAEPEDKR